MSIVITLSTPASRPAQMPPSTPATGPDISSETGSSRAPSADSTPPAEFISWSSS